jgi:hypothetical protein
MGMPRRRGTPLQGQYLSPRHGGKVKGPKVVLATGPVEAAVYINGIPKGHRHVTVTGTRWRPGVGGRQDGRPTSAGKGIGEKCVTPADSIEAAKDVHGAILRDK